MTPQQIRAGRALVGWSNRQLAEVAGIGVNTISRYENNGEAMHSTVTKMQRALEAAGVVFIPSGDYSGQGGPGVRLRVPGE